MARLITSEGEVLDFCPDCFPDIIVAQDDYGIEELSTFIGSNFFEYDVDHPSYCDGCYFCESCGNELV